MTSLTSPSVRRPPRHSQPRSRGVVCSKSSTSSPIALKSLLLSVSTACRKRRARAAQEISPHPRRLSEPSRRAVLMTSCRSSIVTSAWRTSPRSMCFAKRWRNCLCAGDGALPLDLMKHSYETVFVMTKERCSCRAVRKRVVEPTRFQMAQVSVTFTGLKASGITVFPRSRQQHQRRALR